MKEKDKKRMVKNFEEYYKIHGFERYTFRAFLEEAYKLGVKDAK